jgi:hypothetical protein
MTEPFRCIAILAMILAGCSEKKEAKIESNVSVEREITVDDNESYSTTTWSMSLSPRGLSFGRSEASAHMTGPLSDHVAQMSFSDPSEATAVLAKFTDWDELARQNNAEPFRKSLADKCTFEFSHGASTLNYYWKTPYMTFTGTFNRADIDKFNQLLKQLPEAKAELDGKISKAQKEAALFK